MKVLITGATGFIGEFLVEELVRSDYVVTCLVRDIKRGEFLNRLGAKLIEGDINDKVKLQESVKNQDIIFHLAAETDISRISKSTYNRFCSVNVKGTENLLECCKGKKVKKIVHFSSIAVMGLIKDKISDENTECHPVNPYQLSKWEAERLVLDYYKKYNLPVVMVRPTMVYGPSDKDHSEILRMTKFIKKGIFPLVGSGNNSIPIVHVRDLVDGAILAGKYGRPGQIYIITNENKSSFNEIIHTISCEIGKNVLIIRIPKLLAQSVIFPIELLARLFNLKFPFTLKRIESMTSDRVFSVEKAKNELGYRQKIDLKDGFKEMIDWYKINGYL